MSSSSENKNLRDVDRILEEVREMLQFKHDSGTLDELTALQLLLEITKELHSLNNITDLVTKVLDTALSFTGAERAFMMLLDDDEPRFKMGRNQYGDYLSREDFSPSQSIIQQTIANRETLIVPDAQNDETFSKRESIQDLALRTIICSPLMIKRQIIGLLYIDSRQQATQSFSPAQQNVLSSLADQSAVAIRNARKFETYT